MNVFASQSDNIQAKRDGQSAVSRVRQLFRAHRPGPECNLLVALLTCLLVSPHPAHAAEEVRQNRGGPGVTSIAQITVNDENMPIVYPSAVAYDPYLDETYVVTGIPSRVVVYGPDFFPRISIGAGRGLTAPSGLAVSAKGEVYVCQPRTSTNPRPRITILNAAFFVDREIFLDEIPEAAGFIPRKIALNRDGLIYVVGENTRGVMVLNSNGEFLRWLQPVDMVFKGALAQEESRRSAKQDLASQEEPSVDEDRAEEPAQDEPDYENIPEQFRPLSRSELKAANWATKVEAPVTVNFVGIAESDRIYMISTETSKVYVFDEDETFLFSFGKKGGSPGQQSQPRTLAVDEEQQVIYVADYMRHTILVYDLEGEFLFELGGRGLVPGWYNFPTAMVLNRHGQYIVADQFGGRVQVLEMRYQEWLDRYNLDGSSDFGDAGDGASGAPPADREQAPAAPDDGTADGNKLLEPMQDNRDKELGLDFQVIEEPHSQAPVEGGERSPGNPDADILEVVVPDESVPSY